MKARLAIGARALSVAGAVVLSACAGIGPYSTRNGYYTVHKGQTLYAIALNYGLDYKQVARWNGIAAPFTIYPGEKIRLKPPSNASSQQLANGARAAQSAQTGYLRAHKAPMARTPAPAQADTSAALNWQWPTKGRVIHVFSADGAGRKGIDIAGRPGQPIKAAEAGSVVYSGGGLAGYGKLIIIKHKDGFLSAYAHNKALLVKQGEQVRCGQTIARLGSTDAAMPMLHFEIRHQGKPIDPLRYLPQRTAGRLDP